MGFGRREGGGRRSGKRQDAPLVAIYTSITQSHAAFLVDVSAAGAKLRGPHLPQVGDELLVSVERVRAFGTVRWVDGDQFGVAFDADLGADTIHRLHAISASAAGLTPELKAALDEWNLGTPP